MGVSSASTTTMSEEKPSWRWPITRGGRRQPSSGTVRMSPGSVAPCSRMEIQPSISTCPYPTTQHCSMTRRPETVEPSGYQHTLATATTNVRCSHWLVSMSNTASRAPRSRSSGAKRRVGHQNRRSSATYKPKSERLSHRLLLPSLHVPHIEKCLPNRLRDHGFGSPLLPRLTDEHHISSLSIGAAIRLPRCTRASPVAKPRYSLL